MPAPIKKIPEQSRATKIFLAAVGLGLLGVTTVGIYAVTSLPTSPSNKPEPQVQGIATQTEYVPPQDITEPTLPTPDNTNETYVVTAVSDGDTIKVRIGTKIETVRLIGIDTPETKDPRKPVQCFGNEASNYTKEMLLNKNVTLRADTSQSNRDKYGRLLRYVYVNETNFNLQLIQAGYAYEYTYKVAYQFQAEFKAAQNLAEANKIGLWNSATCAGVR